MSPDASDRQESVVANTTETRSVDAVLSAFANEERRAVVRALGASDEDDLAVTTLADRVAERVHGGTADAEYANRAIVRLQHVHLPKLAATDLVVHDTDRDLVRGTVGDRERDLLDCVSAYE